MDILYIMYISLYGNYNILNIMSKMDILYNMEELYNSKHYKLNTITLDIIRYCNN